MIEIYKNIIALLVDVIVELMKVITFGATLTPLQNYRNSVLTIVQPDVWIRPEDNAGHKYQDAISQTTGLGSGVVYGGTVATASVNSFIGEPFIKHDGVASFCDLSALKTGQAMPTNLTALVRLNFDNWADGETRCITRIAKASGVSDIRLYRSATNTLFFRVWDSLGDEKSISINVAGFVGWHTVGLTVDGQTFSLFIDGVFFGAVTTVNVLDGNINSFQLGAYGTPSEMVKGNIIEAIYNFGATKTPLELARLQSKLNQ